VPDYSVDASLPLAVRSLAAALAGELPAGVRPGRRPTLVVKRLVAGDGEEPASFARLVARVRAVVEGAPACAARTAGLDAFDADRREPVERLSLG